MTISLRGFFLPVMFRVLAVICGVTFADHASAEGLRDFLKTIESLDQTIQEKVQGVLGSTKPDRQEGLEQSPGTKVTTTPVTSDKIRIKAQPGVAKESTDTEEEEDKPNLISSKKVQLKSDAILKEGPSGEAGTTEAGQSVMSGSSVGGGDNRQAEAPLQILKPTEPQSDHYNGEQAKILWFGSATDIIERYGTSVGVVTKKVLWRVRLREGYRLNIVDADDRLVGQLVRLDDDGSTWTASQFGQIVCPDGVKQYGGSGSGVLVSDSPVGWVYYSLVDDNPLKDLLPNGAYYASALDKSDGRTFWNSPITSYHDIIAGFRWSVENSNPIPDEAHDGLRVPVDSFRAIFRYFTGDYSTWDPEIRVALDGQMSGSYMRPILPGTSKCVSKTQRRAFWSVDRPLEIKPSLKEVQKNWRPEYDNEANNLSVTANVEQPRIPGKFHFTLFEVTREKGWAMNAGKKNDDSLDLEFVEGLAGFQSPKETSDGWTIETNRTMTVATVKIKANDYGAWGKLKCKVNVDGEWWPCKSEDGKEYVTIPLDQDENKIADFWEEQKGIAGDAAADDDEMPKGREPGDGFSNYEEYRGFQIDGAWQDTDPTEKDLFVHNASGKEEITSGIREFETKSGLTVHEINADELDRTNRIVNFNRGIKQAVSRNDQGQAGVIVSVTELDDLCGKAKSHPLAGTKLGGPNITQLVMINPSCINGSTTVHELGHAVNLWHPGGRYLKNQCGEKRIAGLRTPYAGPMNNYMRWPPPNKYIGPDNKCYKYPSHLEVARSAFVTSPGGTGMNAGPERWEYNTLDGENYPYPVSGDATCPGTLIDKSMSLNQDARPTRGGC